MIEGLVFLTRLVLARDLLGEEDEVGEGAGEDEHAVEGQRQQEQVEIPVVALT
jgi:hypothetical protein